MGRKTSEGQAPEAVIFFSHSMPSTDHSPREGEDKGGGPSEPLLVWGEGPVYE